jgi:hypothetical protein
MFLTAMSQQFSVLAKNGMVAPSQPLATLAGVQRLMGGVLPRASAFTRIHLLSIAIKYE